jgi:hypothetical protein
MICLKYDCIENSNRDPDQGAHRMWIQCGSGFGSWSETLHYAHYSNSIQFKKFLLSPVTMATVYITKIFFNNDWGFNLFYYSTVQKIIYCTITISNIVAFFNIKEKKRGTNCPENNKDSTIYGKWQKKITVLRNPPLYVLRAYFDHYCGQFGAPHLVQCCPRPLFLNPVYQDFSFSIFLISFSHSLNSHYSSSELLYC